jgi:hypothetical protein
MWDVRESQWLDRSTLSSLENDGFGRLLVHVNDQPRSCISCNSRSIIISLKSCME